ncbi:MAG: IgGFc-binding protein [Polyangiaceae bacterium]|nr:IgGFc-binding protein [Polyangiaceae bacterium]
MVTLKHASVQTVCCGVFVLSAFALLGAACSATKQPIGVGGQGGTGVGGQTSSTSNGQGGLGGIGIGSGGGGPSGGVPQTCEAAIAQQSYIGCEYWPTISANSQLFTGFEFAIVAANPTDSPSTVTVTRGAQQIAQVEVPSGGLQTIKLPWVTELKQVDNNFDGSGVVSALVPQGAYHVTSSVPITLYQFNPLEFELVPAPSDCPILGAGCYSYTNDASLLLPTSALRDDYYVMSAPTLHIDTGGGFGFSSWVNLSGSVAITATQNGTNVVVQSSANVKAGNGVGAMSPGGQASFSLNAGDVVLLITAMPPDADTPQPGKPCIDDFNSGVHLCPTGPEYDLTGTHITSDKPISVLGGHDCTFMPYSNYACDHIEESMFPVETLGKDLIVTAPHSVAGIDTNPGEADFMFVRVLSATDNNEITFDPPVAAPVTLNAGKWIEIGPVNQDFRVLGKNKILVAQYMVGEDFGGTSKGAGDPALSIAIPKEQYRVAYTFLAPTTYTHNFVNIVTEPGANVLIDGAAIPEAEFKPIGGTGLIVARHKIQGGAHSMSGDKNFGIVVYGYGSYTSYMYPGGLNLETVVITPE